MKFYLFLFFAMATSSLGFLSGKEIELSSPMYVDNTLLKQEKSLYKKEKKDSLMDQLKNDADVLSPIAYELVNADASKGEVILEDGSVLKINWWYRSTLKSWKQGDHIQVFYHPEYHDSCVCLKNIDSKKEVWGVLESADYCHVVVEKVQTIGGVVQITLSNGWSFERKNYGLSFTWNLDDLVFVFSNEEFACYDLWNITQGTLVFNYKNVLPPPKPVEEKIKVIDLKDVVELEKNLNARVVGQAHASEAIYECMLNYCAGLKNPTTPIGVFLFLGPTGVGKTEMAKALAVELYKSSNDFIRLDMGNFTEPHSMARLIGSPPGYANHEEGGQLTEALKKKPHTIVLLDEIEKAHKQVHKIFLPVFDEGYITDSKDRKVLCNHAIFIMTSNLCSLEIQKLFEEGYTPQEILKEIEPKLMEQLSPEIYNRVEPIVFQPLDKKALESLTLLLLDEVVKKLQVEKNIELTFDPSVKEYLMEHGYQPSLGARPLKKLIQKKVMLTLANAIVTEEIPEGSTITLSYNLEDDSWFISW